MEQWKPVVGYEGLYEISDLGRVKRLPRVYKDCCGRVILLKELILKSRISKQTGYSEIKLTKDGEQLSHCIHRLIAEAFIPNPLNLPCVNHIDQNRANSVLSNLEWCTYSYNNSYGDANKKRKETKRKNLEGRHKTIYQYDSKGNLLNVYTCGVNQLQEKLGYRMKDALLNKCKTANGFVFSYSPIFQYVEDIPKRHQKYVILVDQDNKEICRFKSVSEAGEKCGFDRHLFSRTKPIDGITEIKGFRFIVEKKENEYIPKGHKGPRPDLKYKSSKAVCQYSKDGEFIAEYKSMKDAAAAMGNVKYAPEISNCCNGNLKTARGFIWRKKGEPAPQPFVNDILRKIEQYTTDGKYVNTYESISEAAKALNARAGSINNNLRGISNSAYGFIWKYAK